MRSDYRSSARLGSGKFKMQFLGTNALSQEGQVNEVSTKT